MMTKRNVLRIIGAMLLIAGLAVIFFASPEPVQMISLKDGCVTAIPRIPWAAACAEVSLIVGIGCWISFGIFRRTMKVPDAKP